MRLEAAKRFILDRLGPGSLRPVIARIFPFEQRVEAHRFLPSNEQFDEIVAMI